MAGVQRFGDDEFKCSCGNYAESMGFFPCREDGTNCEPMGIEGWMGHYKCDNPTCNKIYLEGQTVEEGYYYLEECTAPHWCDPSSQCWACDFNKVIKKEATNG